MIDIKGFLMENKNKGLTIRVWFYTAFYRFCIRFIPMKHLRSCFGEEGKESLTEIDVDSYRYAKLVAKQVKLSATHTIWESKCLVQALTAQRLLYKKGIESTLYLGVKKENEQMIAHAWIRVGTLYVTGGNGKDYVVVAKYTK